MSEVISKDKEIDLIELIQTLWQQKWKIVGTAIVCTGIAAGYAFTAKEQWTSKANIVQPEISELGSILPVRAEYARITGNNDFSADGLAKGLYSNFVSYLGSNDLKRLFLEQSDWVKKKFDGKTEKEKQVFISNFINQDLTITQPINNNDKNKEEKKLDNVGVNVRLASETPDGAQELLSQYVVFVNNYVSNEINKDFKASFDLHLDNLRFNKEKITANLDEAKTVTIENLTKALDTAKKAGITDFSKNVSASTQNMLLPSYLTGEAKLNISDSKLADGTYLFMLGEKYLQAQLDIVKGTKVTYPLEYYRIERELSQLEPLATKLNTIADVKTYRYLASPDYPVIKDKPKKALILGIGALLGLFLSSIVIIISSLFRRK